MNTNRHLALFVVAAVLGGCGGRTRMDGGDSSREMQGAPETGSQAHPQSTERGKYLATAVALCAFCHSDVDWTAEGFPPKPGTVGGGRAPFSPAMTWLTSPNISPDRETGAGTWSDAQFEKALRRGIGHDGRVLYPLMPYHEFHAMSDEDAASIVLFLRSLPPVHHELPPTRIPDEMKSTLAPLPPAGAVKAPERSTSAAYGKYLAALALCGQCHTPKDAKGNPVEGMEFAGGLRLKGPWGDVAALNITPDDTGIDGLSEKMFATAMRTGHLPGGGRLNAIMPWGYYQHLTDGDLQSLYHYLKSLKPVPHLVDNSSPPTPCKKCGGIHGLGQANR